MLSLLRGARTVRRQREQEDLVRFSASIHKAGEGALGLRARCNGAGDVELLNHPAALDGDLRPPDGEVVADRPLRHVVDAVVVDQPRRAAGVC
jgi:hypothetical protein